MSLDDIYIPPTPKQERDAARAEVERLRALLREVAGSEVQKHYDAVTAVLIKGGLWGRLREEFNQ